MAAPTRTIHIAPGSELSRTLDAAAEEGAVLELEGVLYRLVRADTDASIEPRPRRRGRLEPERVLDLIGIGASAEETQIARYKDAYLAEAADHRGS